MLGVTAPGIRDVWAGVVVTPGMGAKVAVDWVVGLAVGCAAGLSLLRSVTPSRGFTVSGLDLGIRRLPQSPVAYTLLGSKADKSTSSSMSSLA